MPIFHTFWTIIAGRTVSARRHEKRGGDQDCSDQRAIVLPLDEREFLTPSVVFHVNSFLLVDGDWLNRTSVEPVEKLVVPACYFVRERNRRTIEPRRYELPSN